MKLRFDRRRFLRGTFGSLGAIIAARVGWLFPEGQQALAGIRRAAQEGTAAQSPVEGELYSGFFLLPEGAPVPDFVQKARGIILHGDDDLHDPTLAGEGIQVNSLEELRGHISFPLYIPTTLPPNMQFINANVLRFVRSGEIWGVAINFGTGNTADGLISVWAAPEFPRPFPVWPVRFPFAYDSGPILPEKATLSPSPGVMLPSVLGYIFQWIRHDILYALVVENHPSREYAETIARSVAQA